MKKVFILLVVAIVTNVTFAQGFGSISIADASGVKALTVVSVRGTPNELQAVVPPNFDFSNVVIQATPEDGAEIVGTLPAVFENNVSQDITLKKTDDSGNRTWHLTIKKVNPAALPFAKTFSNSTGNKTADWTTGVLGWAFAGIDTGTAAAARYGAATVSFVVAFSDAPGTVSYQLNTVSNNLANGDEFDVEASANGSVWRTLRSFTQANALTTTATSFQDDLQSTDRYVRWVYVKRTSNLNLNNISVTKADEVTVGAPLEITSTGYGLGKFSVKNALQLYAKTSSSIRDALELHAVVAESFDFSKPANNVLEAASGYTSNPSTLPTNFSTPQNVTFSKDGTDNVWTIYVKPLKLATSLPLTLNFNNDNQSIWDENAAGWVTCGTNVGRASTVAFDGSKTAFIIGFNQSAAILSYDLCINAQSTTIPDDAVFEILTSDESATAWTRLYKYDKDNQIPSSNAANINRQLSLASDVRYVKFLYTERGASGGKNLNLNNIIVSDISSSIQHTDAAKQVVFYQPAPGEIVFTRTVSKVEVYNLLGGLTATYNNPSNKISIADGTKGIAIVRATLADGAVVSQKARK